MGQYQTRFSYDIQIRKKEVYDEEIIIKAKIIKKIQREIIRWLQNKHAKNCLIKRVSSLLI